MKQCIHNAGTNKIATIRSSSTFPLNMSNWSASVSPIHHTLSVSGSVVAEAVFTSDTEQTTAIGCEMSGRGAKGEVSDGALSLWRKP